MLQILLRFRQHQYAVPADIEGMCLQVGVPEKDQPSLRFLWRESPSELIKVYQYTRHIFVAKGSPTCANYALNRTGVDNAAKFPEAAIAVKENFYMDDYLDSRPTLEGIESLAKDLIQLLSIGGFKLTKWTSNAPQLADHLNTFADSHHNRQTQLSPSSSIEEGIDKTRRNTFSSPRQRTSQSTQLGSSKVSPASPRYHTTRHSTLKVKAMENLTAVKKMSLGDEVHSLSSEVKHATWPESTKNKQCEDCPSSASIVSPASPANPSVLGLRCKTDQDTLIVSRGTTPDSIGNTITKRRVLITVSSVLDPIGLIARSPYEPVYS